MKLTRGERFSEARARLPKEQQSMDMVEKATGVTKSLIQALEDDDKDRDAGYSKIAALAAHYKVSSDYLIGLTDDPSRQLRAVDELGLHPRVITRLKYSRNDCSIYSDAALINGLVKNEKFNELKFLTINTVVMTQTSRTCVNPNNYSLFTIPGEDEKLHQLLLDAFREGATLIPIKDAPMLYKKCVIDKFSEILDDIIEDMLNDYVLYQDSLGQKEENENGTEEQS